MTQSSDPTRTVPTRRISFDEALADVPKHFAADGDLITSHLIATLSALFPDGEDFFVRTVRHYRDQITDPDLKRQVNGFIGQEAMHGREHRVLNERLAELGYPTKRVANMARRGLGIREKVASPAANLAATAALEHFTATLAELSLTDPEMQRMAGHAAVRDILLWHALEEAEHKAVAFDVYRAVGGSERTRIITMKATRIGFVLGVTFQLALSLLGDPATFQKGRLRKSLKQFRRSAIMTSGVWKRLKDYDRPGFHPDDWDTSELVDRWSAELFGEHGTLLDKLAAGRGATAGSDQPAEPVGASA
ncbi:MAG: metal-dependent hydrolase [Acidimicrobiales bacterium]|nr:metal-dependent hydrolase [Actinomycetota bacterium]